MGSGCCGPPPAPATEPPAAPNAAQSDATSSCQDECCDAGDSNDGDAAPVEASEPGQASATLDNNNCCSSGQCADSNSEDDSDAPACCRGTTAPCCDTSCLDRLALRECSMSEHLLPKEGAESTDFDGAPEGKACNRHITSALDRYGATLEALGCLCRSLIALGQETCCEIRERHSLSSATSSPSIDQPTARRSLPRAQLDSCCSTGPTTPSQAAQNRLRLRKTCGQSISSATKPSAGACAGSCCSNDKPAKVPSVKNDSCQVSCADACCSSPPADAPVVGKVPVQTINDVENQGAGKEHVVLSVSGMTCTGCETKLNRTLATVPAVRDLKTSLVLSRAEFDIDLRLGSVDEVVKHLERTTEFKCERIRSQGASLDIIVPSEPAQFMSQAWPEGVIDMALVCKQIVRVAFDARTVGARDLVEKIWGPPVELAPPRGDTALEAGSKHVRHVGYMTLLSAILTIPVLVMAWAPLPDSRELAYSSASLALATIVQVVIAGPFYPKALKALVFSRVIEMDLLIVLSTSAAYIFSVISFGYFVAGNPLSTGQFFETSTLLVTLIMVGRWVAALARQKAVESISIRSLQASTAVLCDKESGGEREIDARLLQYGDTFKVLPDTRVPTDGTVLTGSSEVDESMLTGESRPVEKYPKSVVIAGSINGPGVMTVRLTRLPGDNTIHAIAAMVDEAKLSKPKLQDLADQVASYFVPVVVALTIITFVIWIAVGVAVRGYGAAKATVEAITYAITVLIVSCPCAIGLAVPMVVVIASGVAAERGIIFKSATAIEVAHKTSHVVFDKTGTLTRGKLAVVGNECIDNEALPLLLGLVENSRHPVSVGVAAHLRDTGVTSVTVPEPKSLTGKGIETTLGGRKLQAGNSRWLGQSDNELVQLLLTQGCTVLCFAIDNELKAVYGLEDELRPDAAKTVETLQERGVSVHVVSGDDDGAVRALASKLRIPSDNVRSRSSPADKKDYVQTLLGAATGHKQPVVVFCGDGTNDAVALAQATIGVHMNEGTDVAQSAADVVLMRPTLGGILTMINASRKSVHRIWFNFGWSFVYNTFAVLLAAGAFVNARIPPEFAGLGELVSVLPVIAAAVLLRWSKI